MSELRTGVRHTASLEDLRALAGDLWSNLERGAVVWLTGDLGSGKTAFVQALARVAEAEPALSPTFALIHEYLAPEGVLVHVDCYRLRSPEEALDLDLPELTARARITLIEWPERAGVFAPEPDAHVTFAHTDDRACRLVERIA